MLYKDTGWTVQLLVESIKRGQLALPDIQRPFVWQTAKVRDLFDSMYRGFPVGSLLFWETGAEKGTRQIGVDTPQPVPNHLIVDGQQRLTSLFAVMTGKKVLRDDYRETELRIAFRPTDATFAVADAAIERDPEFIHDISPLWQPHRRYPTINNFLTKVRVRREIDGTEEERLRQAIDRLCELQYYQFNVVETQRRRGGHAGGRDLRADQQRGRHADPG